MTARDWVSLVLARAYNLAATRADNTHSSAAVSPPPPAVPTFHPSANLTNLLCNHLSSNSLSILWAESCFSVKTSMMCQSFLLPFSTKCTMRFNNRFMTPNWQNTKLQNRPWPPRWSGDTAQNIPLISNFKIGSKLGPKLFLANCSHNSMATHHFWGYKIILFETAIYTKPYDTTYNFRILKFLGRLCQNHIKQQPAMFFFT